MPSWNCVEAGGMGIVYKAHDPRLGRHVALKFLPPHLDSQSAPKQRFLIEARAAAALDHPNICTILEIGETDSGQLFLAMPLYDGETVAAAVEARAAAVRRSASASPCRSRAASAPPTPTASSIATSSRRTSCSSATER